MVDPPRMTDREFYHWVGSPSRGQGPAAGGIAAVVDLTGWAPPDSVAVRTAVADLAGVVVGVAAGVPAAVAAGLARPVATGPAAGLARPASTGAAVGLARAMDVVLAEAGGEGPGVVVVGHDHGMDAALGRVVDAVASRPQAATALALLLRGAERRSVPDGLVAESAVYSMLQAGPEFATWRAGRAPAGPAVEEEDPVILAREGAHLEIILSRPHVHNALNAAMRGALVDALAVAASDPDLAVSLRGAGPSFCSGGDLSEFGTAPDPVSAHLIRLSRSPAAALARVGHRLEAHVQGACLGAGVELAAFAGRVVARPDTFFALPELAFGLIPGAGGTVSLPRRIGRHRTLWLALTGERLDVARARSWGLVDTVSEP